MKTRIPLFQAEALANKIIESLTSGCEKIAIAGSIRQQRPTVGDIEFVAIPKIQPANGTMISLFGDMPSDTELALDSVIDALLAEKPHFRRKDKNGGKFKNFEIDTPSGSIQLDLFLTTVNQWRWIFAIRTGSQKFSKQLVTQRSQGGLMPSGYRMIDGWLTQLGECIEMPGEREMLELCGGWIEPWKR